MFRILCLLLAIGAVPADACSCLRNPESEKWDQATTIVVGVVTSGVVVDGNSSEKQDKLEYKFLVTETLKGHVPIHTEVQLIPPGGYCGGHLWQGFTYLVYSGDVSRELPVSRCNTRMLDYPSNLPDEERFRNPDKVEELRGLLRAMVAPGQEELQRLREHLLNKAMLGAALDSQPPAARPSWRR